MSECSQCDYEALSPLQQARMEIATCRDYLDSSRNVSPEIWQSILNVAIEQLDIALERIDAAKEAV